MGLTTTILVSPSPDTYDIAFTFARFGIVIKE